MCFPVAGKPQYMLEKHFIFMCILHVMNIDQTQNVTDWY
jgi:hypothetical protein